ncbi:MAG: PH domain-containing protein [Methanobrevibacter sp.]|jgi:membrane protein YdbS with pleckstrin-like domain|nr:PH domain-containing protein [Candidatus Methanovirga aequatorialis]
MFERDDDEFINENVLYKSQPNLIFSIKKAIALSIILWIIFTYSGSLQKYIQRLSDPQQSNAMITNILQTIHINAVVSIATLVLIFILIIWITWILIKWIKTEYILTDSRIILKRGVINLKADYVMYNHIQDLRFSQGIIGKIFSVGTIEIYSGYSKESLKFKNMNTPKKVQRIIFSEMKHDYSFNRNNQFGSGYNPRYSDTAQQNPNHQYQQNHNYQRDYMEYDEDNFDSAMNNAMKDLNRENSFRQNPKNPKFFNNTRDGYSDRRTPSKINQEKREHNKKQNNKNDENVSILEKHSRKFRK